MPAITRSRHAELTGVQKAPRHEVAGSWAPAGQRVLWGFDVSADVDGGCVHKAPRHEVAGSWAPAGQRVLWGFDVSADVDGGCNAARKRSGCVDRRGGEPAMGISASARSASAGARRIDRRVRDYAEAGGLLSYGPVLSDNFKRCAALVDKILRGASPAELPFEQPTHYELVVNLKTAKALALTIPPSILVRVDEVIE